MKIRRETHEYNTAARHEQGQDRSLMMCVREGVFILHITVFVSDVDKQIKIIDKN